MAATYNGAGAGGLTPIVIAAGADYVKAVCHTRRGQVQARRHEYSFPGLSGSGSDAFGLEPQDIYWELLLELSSGAGVSALESLLRSYQRGGGRYTLLSETGENWYYVTLVDYQVKEIEGLVGSTNVLATIEVHFREMQP